MFASHFTIHGWICCGLFCSIKYHNKKRCSFVCRGMCTCSCFCNNCASLDLLFHGVSWIKAKDSIDQLDLSEGFFFHYCDLYFWFSALFHGLAGYLFNCLLLGLIIPKFLGPCFPISDTSSEFDFSYTQSNSLY